MLWAIGFRECVLDETTKGGDSDSYSGETATYHLFVCWSHSYFFPVCLARKLVDP
jgi:hypothetical protein